ncbi:hypothetical protein B0H63DRAFT_64926 [Podospora didyma]|uniref:Uncharacterized protein n=1 Tax=Podospora didyma TaxID=330526 RepID=A0AAE0P8D0_9PEZI|nr:hypothetical protein B0H63DRAFT_64926 [Podospora didyma]
MMMLLVFDIAWLRKTLASGRTVDFDVDQRQLCQCALTARPIQNVRGKRDEAISEANLIPLLISFMLNFLAG